MTNSATKIMIIYNEYFATMQDYHIVALKEAITTLGIQVDIISGNDCSLNIDIATNYDIALLREKNVPLAIALEARGVKVYNNAKTTAICDDKLLMQLQIEQAHIRTPQSLFSPQTYGKEIGNIYIDSIMEELGYPFVIKEAQSSYGIGCKLIDDLDKIEELSHITTRLLFQEYIAEAKGIDTRIYIVGDKVIGAIERRATITNEFRSNIELGAKAYLTKPTEEMITLAHKAIKAVGADYGGVDIIQSNKGALVLEVNSNANFQALDSCLNISTANYIAKYVMENRIK